MRLVVPSLAALALSGCASIFNGQAQPVTIRSVPEGAALTVTNRAGDNVHTGTAPATVTLKRGAGYFKAEEYKVVLRKDGFADRELTITGTMSGWYIGNLLFGGVIGMLAVDPVTGGMYVFPESVTGTLDAQGTKTSAAEDRLTIVSTDSLTAEQLRHARLLSATN
ncbi:MAG: hypothetical protein U1E89_12590 [Burkholderiaceae bacterium]